MNGFVAEHGVGGHEGEGAAYPGEPTGEGRGYAQGEGGGYASGEGGGYTTGEGGGYATGEGGGYATGEGGGYTTGEGGGYATGEGGGYATGARGGYAQGEGGGYATGEGGGYATGAGGEYATVQGEGYEQGEGGGNETGVGGGYATGAGGEYETREGDGYEGEEGGEDGGEEGGEDEGEEWGEEEGEEWGEDGTGEQGAYASGEGGVHATVQGGGYVTEEGGGYGTVRGGEDEGDEWGEGGTGEQGAYTAREGGVHATVQGGGYEGEEGGENGTGEGGGYAAGEGGRYVVRGGKVYEEQEGGEFAAQGEGGYEAEEGGRVMAEGGEDGRARDPAEGDGALNAAVRQEAHEGGEDDAEDDDVERMLYPVRPVAEASRGSTMDESEEEAAAIMRGKAKCMATLNMDEGTGAAKHGAEGGEKGEVGEQGGAEGEEGEAEDRMMERGKGVEGEAAAEQGGAEGEEGEAEDKMNKREKGVEGGASGVEGAAEIVERVNLAAGLEVEEGAKEWDEEEEGVPQEMHGGGGRERRGCAWSSLLLSYWVIFRPAVLTQPALCHLSTLASLPLTGDARRRREGEAGVCMVLSAPFLLGYFQARCSHPARSLPSFHPCLPAIDRRCTEEEGGRGGGHSNHELGAIPNGIGGRISGGARTAASAPASPASMGRAPVAHGPSDTHRGGGRERDTHRGGGRERVRSAWARSYSHLFLSLCLLISPPLAGHAQRRREGEAVEMHRGVGKEAAVCVSLHAACIGFDSYPATPLILSSVSVLISLPLAGNAQRWREGEAEEMQRREGEAKVCVGLYIAPLCIALVSLTLLEIEQISEEL
ncbi:unnamed protein product [Closterium sp. NIES-64]|nr:unnamed protein product [Closterium sp. NIES-64]